MDVIYLSDGEQNAVMDFADLEANYRDSMAGAPSCEIAGFASVDELINDIVGALDGQGFWHGSVHVYNVAITRADLVRNLLDQ